MAESVESPTILVYTTSSTHLIDEILSRSFLVLSPRTCPDPLPIFLSRYAASIKALVVDGRRPVTAEILSLLPSLELLVCTSVGVDRLDINECRRRRIAITNAGNAFSEDVADCAIGLLISVLRCVSAADRYVRSGNWAKLGDYPLGIKIGRKRVGIVGLGGIGSLVAKRLEPFGCIISYNSRTKKQEFPYAYYPNILSLAANNDILILCCSLTDQTHHIVNRQVMETLGKDGVIINVGRGGLIDEKEMVKCLVGGVIGGAGLDVFENEPDVPEELFGLDNVVLSPHTAASTIGCLERVAEVALANLMAFYSNQPLISPV